MLRNAKDLYGFTIRATDGELGVVDQFYFDDESWAIRYLTVETGGWLGGRLVLISPISVIGQPDWESKQLNVSLTKKQVENSPDISTHQPVSRQHEIEYLGYYGYPFYWSGSYLWGSALYPGGLAVPAAPLIEAVPPPTENQSADSHLRSAREVTGYYIEASDGEIGHLDGFVVDHETWAIRYVEVATRNWWPGKKVLVSPAWIERISWAESNVYVGVSREVIRNSPEYIESVPVTRDYEKRLYFHYGKPPYWLPKSLPFGVNANESVSDRKLATITSSDQEAFRENFQRHYGDSGASYEDFAPAYEFGFQQAMDPRYHAQTFLHVEPMLKSEFTQDHPEANWDQLYDAILYGWEKAGGDVGGWPII